MKKLIIIGLAFGLFACSSTKESSSKSTKAETKPMQTENATGEVSGIIKDMTKTDGCDFVIAVTVDGSETLLEPLELDSKYKVDGKSVSLIYQPSRRASKCMGTMPITIEKIK